MGLLARTTHIIRAKFNAILNRAENPTEDLDYAYTQMKDGISEVEEAIKTTRTQIVRLKRRQERLEDEVEHHNEQAREAMGQDREDLARRALTKKKTKMNVIEELDGQIEALHSQEESLDQKLSKYRTRVSEFRTEKETMKARYEAADSMTNVQEIISGLDTDGAGAAIEDAESSIEEMEARAQAVDELQSDGAFNSPLQDDDIESELHDLTTASEVEDELGTLKSEMDTETAVEASSD